MQLQYKLIIFTELTLNQNESNRNIYFVCCTCTFSYFLLPFLQFDEVALNSALWLLDKAELSPKAMSNVIHVVRTMTSMVSAPFIGMLLPSEEHSYARQLKVKVKGKGSSSRLGA